MAGASADVALALKTLSIKATCSHCGKQPTELRRCSRCKHASYCGAECQNAGWKKHKKTCGAPPLSPEEVFEKVQAARVAGNWRGVLAWEGCLEELREGLHDSGFNAILAAFIYSHDLMVHAGFLSDYHALSSVRLRIERVDLLGKMERFRDQKRKGNVRDGALPRPKKERKCARSLDPSSSWAEMRTQ